MEVRKVEERILREVIVKIRLERINTQEGITVEALLDSGATGLVISSELAKKQGFKLKKLEIVVATTRLNCPMVSLTSKAQNRL